MKTGKQIRSGCSLEHKYYYDVCPMEVSDILLADEQEFTTLCR
jgi:hypothetical protein